MIRATASQVKAARKKSGLTQKQAAELIGYTVRAWQSWEQDERPMRKKLLETFIALVNRSTP